MTMLRRSAPAVALAIVAVFASACGSSAGAAECNSAVDPTKGKTINLPPTLGGLRVQEEDKASEQLVKESETNSYVCDGRVFSLRQGEELRAVFQVLRLTPDSRPDDRDWRRTVAVGMDLQRAPERVGETLVYSGRFNKQLIQMWFVERFMLVMTVRESATVAGEPVGVDFKQLSAEALSLRPVGT